MPRALCEGSAPSARLGPPEARAAATHPGAPPQPLGCCLPWPLQRASGRPKDEELPPATDRPRRAQPLTQPVGSLRRPPPHSGGGARSAPGPVKTALEQSHLEQLRSGGAAAEAEELSFTELKWSDAEGAALVGALRAAHERGGLQKLEKLILNGNQMGDETAAALASLLEAGAMPKLKRLYLEGNRIGEAGMAALASAVRGGALPSCESIYLDGNPGSAAPLKEAVAQRARA